ncbi:hypothetical protein LTR53_000156 [Teratosphaeriaceae sp. CCFEE 6253]|nr:hypothetical protein LTR53_000156 [Teratosphaeriaceae sp. CCFEE 6253]
MAPSNALHHTRPRTKQEPRATFPDFRHPHAVATLGPSTRACSPRSPLITRPSRPAELRFAKSNGLTTVTTRDLRGILTGDGHTDIACVTTTHAPHPKSKPRRRSEPPTVVPMGNKPSSLNGSPPPGDNASLRSVERRPVRILRKSSNNLLKRLDFDSKSPLPRPLTSTSIIITAHAKPDSPTDPYLDPAHSARESVLMLPSASEMTITDDSAGQPLSAQTTLKDSRHDSKTPYQAAVEDEEEDLVEVPPPVPTHRSSALSPTLPAPSPLPEDSPHKYGLKDNMDTPEPEPVAAPVDINVNKARRRSSGLEIFTEAKTLQSASSFLNGLSTNRRRAESQNRTDESWATSFVSSGQLSRPVSRPGSRPASARPPSAARLPKGCADMDNRRRGHNFKGTGFAFSRPLNLTQLKCYRNHARLLMSKNKKAPVECAMCHMDDEQEHWTCSWCAVRMCRYCRKTLAEGGVTALRERVKQAESGGSPSSSTDSLGRGRSRACV